jgi:hypothetical protein
MTNSITVVNSSAFYIPQRNQWQFAHVHVPRTGGMSIFSFFEEVLGPSLCSRYGTHQAVQALERLNPADLRQYRYIGAHTQAYVLAGKLSAPTRFVFAVVRDPVAVEISTYLYMRAGRSEYLLAEDTTFDQYLDTVEASPLRQNFQSKALWFHDDMHSASAKEIILEWAMCRAALCTFDTIFKLQEYLKLILGTASVFNIVNATKDRFEATAPQIDRIRSIHQVDFEMFDILSSANGGFLPDWRYAHRGTSCVGPLS